ncbi:MAG: hypothetical protein ACK4LB_05575 [Spirosomataceae bacterium]
MKKIISYFTISLFIFFGYGCKKEEVSSSFLIGVWGVSNVEVLINDKITPISSNSFDSNFKHVKHVFNEDFTYEFIDMDGSKVQGTWEYLSQSKEILVEYPELGYVERYEVLTNSANEVVLRTPIIDVTKAESDQEFEILFTASFLLVDTPSNLVEPKTLGLQYKLLK